MATVPSISLAPLPSPELSDLEETSYLSVGGLGSPNFNAEPLQHKPLEGRSASYSRKLGDSELSYYLPSRANGVNDMYLHLGFKAPERVVQRSRIRAVWSILRMRHPLLASKIDMRAYDDVRFVFTPPTSPEDALIEAESQLQYKTDSKDELIDAYLNGPRTLSNDRLSFLIISRSMGSDASLPTPPQSPTLSNVLLQSADEPENDYEWFMCAAHFIGDGMALHTFANDFFELLGSMRSQEDLEELVAEEWQQRWGKFVPDGVPALPVSPEERLPETQGKFRRAVGRVDFERNQERQIGGQAFPRKSVQVRHTVVPTVPFDKDVTKAMLRKCKSQGVSIASALFAICNIAWARMSPREKQTLPMMMYAALNIRPYFVPRPLNDSYWFLAVGYFNVILPNFIPSSCDVSKTFWLRARAAKDQSARAAKNPMIVSRSKEMSLKRGQQSRAWAREDDEKERGTWVAPPSKPKDVTATTPRAPSAALIGLSLLGNLDAMYKHATFPVIKMHTLTTGSRQRNGGMLLFGYTFAGKLWVSLGYDENGFERKVIDQFWSNVLGGIEEFLV